MFKTAATAQGCFERLLSVRDALYIGVSDSELLFLWRRFLVNEVVHAKQVRELHVIVTFDGHSVGHPDRPLDMENKNVGELAEGQLFVEGGFDEGFTRLSSEHSRASSALDVPDGFSRDEGEEELIEGQSSLEFRNRVATGWNRQCHAVKRIVSDGTGVVTFGASELRGEETAERRRLGF